MITSLFCILVLLAHDRGQLVVLRHVDQPKLAVLRGLADYNDHIDIELPMSLRYSD